MMAPVAVPEAAAATPGPQRLAATGGKPSNDVTLAIALLVTVVVFISAGLCFARRKAAVLAVIQESGQELSRGGATGSTEIGSAPGSDDQLPQDQLDMVPARPYNNLDDGHESSAEGQRERMQRSWMAEPMKAGGGWWQPSNTGPCSLASSKTRDERQQPHQEQQQQDSCHCCCSICGGEFEDGVQVRQLPCQHLFHSACVDPWLLNCAATCPLWYVTTLSSRLPFLSAHRPSCMIA